MIIIKQLFSNLSNSQKATEGGIRTYMKKYLSTSRKLLVRASTGLLMVGLLFTSGVAPAYASVVDDLKVTVANILVSANALPASTVAEITAKIAVLENAKTLQQQVELLDPTSAQDSASSANTAEQGASASASTGSQSSGATSAANNNNVRPSFFFSYTSGRFFMLSWHPVVPNGKTFYLSQIMTVANDTSSPVATRGCNSVAGESWEKSINCTETTYVTRPRSDGQLADGTVQTYRQYFTGTRYIVVRTVYTDWSSSNWSNPVKIVDGTIDRDYWESITIATTPYNWNSTTADSTTNNTDTTEDGTPNADSIIGRFPPVGPVITSFTANRNTTSVNNPIVVSWATTGVVAESKSKECTASGDWSGLMGGNSSTQVNFLTAGTKTLTLTCRGIDGIQSQPKSVSIRVTNTESGDTTNTSSYTVAITSLSDNAMWSRGSSQRLFWRTSPAVPANSQFGIYITSPSGSQERVASTDASRFGNGTETVWYTDWAVPASYAPGVYGIQVRITPPNTATVSSATTGANSTFTIPGTNDTNTTSTTGANASAPINFRATRSVSGKVVLTWEQPVTSNLSGYVLYRRDSNSLGDRTNGILISKNDRTYSDQGQLLATPLPRDNQTYYYFLVSKDNDNSLANYASPVMATAGPYEANLTVFPLSVGWTYFAFTSKPASIVNAESFLQRVNSTGGSCSAMSFTNSANSQSQYFINGKFNDFNLTTGVTYGIYCSAGSNVRTSTDLQLERRADPTVSDDSGNDDTDGDTTTRRRDPDVNRDNVVNTADTTAIEAALVAESTDPIYDASGDGSFIYPSDVLFVAGYITTSPTRELLSPDVNDDGFVDQADMDIVTLNTGATLTTTGAWVGGNGNCGWKCDIDGSGMVNTFDVLYVSNYVNGTMSEVPAIASRANMVTNLEGSINPNGTITLSWTPAAPALRALNVNLNKSYIIYRRTTNSLTNFTGGVRIDSVSQDSIVDNEFNFGGAPVAGQTYYYWVITEGPNNGADNSAAATITVTQTGSKVALSAPIVTPTISGTTLTLSWPHVSGADKYDLRYNGVSNNVTPAGDVGSTNIPAWTSMNYHYSGFGSSATRSAVFTNLVRGKRYVFHIFSIAQSGSTQYNNSGNREIIVEVPSTTTSTPVLNITAVGDSYSLSANAVTVPASVFTECSTCSTVPAGHKRALVQYNFSNVPSGSSIYFTRDGADAGNYTLGTTDSNTSSYVHISPLSAGGTANIVATIKNGSTVIVSKTFTVSIEAAANPTLSISSSSGAPFSNAAGTNNPIQTNVVGGSGPAYIYWWVTPRVGSNFDDSRPSSSVNNATIARGASTFNYGTGFATPGDYYLIVELVQDVAGTAYSPRMVRSMGFTIEAPVVALTVSLSSDKTSITSGQSATLSLSANRDSAHPVSNCTLRAGTPTIYSGSPTIWTGSLTSTPATKVVTPSEPTQYQIVCADSSQNISSTAVSINVTPATASSVFGNLTDSQAVQPYRTNDRNSAGQYHIAWLKCVTASSVSNPASNLSARIESTTGGATRNLGFGWGSGTSFNFAFTQAGYPGWDEPGRFVCKDNVSGVEKSVLKRCTSDGCFDAPTSANSSQLASMVSILEAIRALLK